MVYHGVGGGITAYQDGVKIGTDTILSVHTQPSGNGTVIIGMRELGEGKRFATASVDDIKFYNYQLTEQEICQLY